LDCKARLKEISIKLYKTLEKRTKVAANRSDRESEGAAVSLSDKTKESSL
jgi:hypothetical protein